MTRTYPKIQKSLKGSNNEQNVQSFQEKGDDVWNVGGIGGYFFYTSQIAEELHPADLENTAILDYNC